MLWKVSKNLIKVKTNYFWINLFRVGTFLSHIRGAQNNHQALWGDGNICSVMCLREKGLLDPLPLGFFDVLQLCSMPQPPAALLRSLCHSPVYQPLYVILHLRRTNKFT